MWTGGAAGAARPRRGASRVHPGRASAGRAAPAARRPPLGAAGAPRRRRSRPGPAAESGPPVRPRDPTLRQAWPRERPGAAVCVQGVDDQCVLQFTLVNAAGCALHRCTSRVIHRSESRSRSLSPPLSLSLSASSGTVRGGPAGEAAAGARGARGVTPAAL